MQKSLQVLQVFYQEFGLLVRSTQFFLAWLGELFKKRALKHTSCFPVITLPATCDGGPAFFLSCLFFLGFFLNTESPAMLSDL